MDDIAIFERKFYDLEQNPYEHKNVMFFHELQLKNHPMFPKNHTRMSVEEFNKERPDINVKEIPKIYTHDLGARVARATIGEVVKITRKDGSVYYREVIVEEKIWKNYCKLLNKSF
jgi:DNA-directed RNA polymerase subunit H (RpoH/RPB5)